MILSAGRPLATLHVPPGLHAEPMEVGVALPRGALPAQAALLDGAGRAVPAGFTALHRWPDGSIAWLLVAFVAPPAGGAFSLFTGPDGAPAPKVLASFGPLLPRGARLVLEMDGRTVAFEFTETERVRDALRDVSRGEATQGELRALRAELRSTRWPSLGLTRLELVLHNPGPARHQGGLWDLGDPGSARFTDLSLLIPVAGEVELAAEPGLPFEPLGPEAALFQASSGGERWDCENHVEADGQVHLAFRGYRLGQRSGLRAAPTLRSAGLVVTPSEFWQNFPKALGRRGADARLALFPAEHGRPHELQGGERKRHVVWLSESHDLSFVHAPRRAIQRAEELSASGCLHRLGLPAADDPQVAAHVAQVVAEKDGFAARRELIDEYGWRNYGDLNADHEAVRAEPGGPFISHYNNQYDCVEAFLLWFLRTGDRRWFDLADPLARHVVDIDLYHTTKDRSAYSGGQFWHTDHHVPARTATHRCHSAKNAGTGPYGGGPGNEQNYPSGLWLHHLLTGDPFSREAAIGLADWVLRMEDGALNVLGLVDPGPTGASSQTYSPDYHGPGRGAGNSVNALCDACRHTGQAHYIEAAERLIARCVHPSQDLDALDLLDAERRWSYVVFLKYLLKYLHLKEALGSLDAPWRFGRAALLHYTRFMVAHERASTSRADALEFVTETWPAQDLRKAQVVAAAAAYVDGAERTAFMAWAAGMWRSAFIELLGYPTALLCRPLVLVLHPAIDRAYASVHPNEHAPADPEPDAPFPLLPADPFLPQKARLKQALRSPSALARLLRRRLGLSP